MGREIFRTQEIEHQNGDFGNEQGDLSLVPFAIDQIFSQDLEELAKQTYGESVFASVVQQKVEEEDTSVDILRVYLREIGQYTNPTHAQEIDFARRIESGKTATAALEEGGIPDTELDTYRSSTEDGKQAFEQFFTANLRLVVSIAKGYASGNRELLLDYIQVGNLGLKRAIDKYDWKKGFRFSTYGTWWIRQAITRYIDESSREVRLPVYMNGVVRKGNKVIRNFEEEEGREIRLSELDEVLMRGNFTEEERGNLIEVYSRGFAGRLPSLDRKVGDEGDSTFGDFISEPAERDDATGETATNQVIHEALQGILRSGVLNEKEIDIQ